METQMENRLNRLGSPKGLQTRQDLITRFTTNKTRAAKSNARISLGLPLTIEASTRTYERKPHTTHDSSAMKKHANTWKGKEPGFSLSRQQTLSYFPAAA